MKRPIHTILLTIAFTALSLAQRSPYFPERGPAATHQLMRELNTPAVVLLVALQPGYEDLALLSRLRLADGAAGVVLYATNGEATPGDDGGTAPVYIAAQRKEEAYQVTTFLGSTAYFLNLRDPGIVPRNEVLKLLWNPDTVVARMERALRYFRPDVVIVDGDRRGETVQSDRQRLLTDLLLKAVRIVGNRPESSNTVRSSPWKVERVFVESTGRTHLVERSFDAAHPFWKKSYRTIAGEAVRLYGSLKFQSRAWVDDGDRSYTMVWPRREAARVSMLNGLPRLGVEAHAFRPIIDRLVRRQGAGVGAPGLADVARAIDSLDVVLARHRVTLGSDDLRIIANWKNKLEMLRCSLLGVHVEYHVDSLVTRSQLVYLRFGRVAPFADSARTRIFFPGAINHSWGINESLENSFPFSPHCEFRIITPWKLDFSVPMSLFGVTQASLWTRFSFIIVHRDSLPTKDYIYRGEVPFLGGPRRTQEVLTPIVRALDDEPVVVRLMNISRDAYKGTLSLEDSLAIPAEKEVVLSGKNDISIDTVRLSFRAPLPPGDYPMKLTLSGGDELPFVARSMEVKVDPSAHVGLLTSLDGSPVQQALNRLRMRWEKIDSALGESKSLDRYSTVLIEREALAGFRSPEVIWNNILDWVRKGGNLVVLPPASFGVPSVHIPNVKFDPKLMLAPSVPVVVDSMEHLLRWPNQLTGEDWDQWVIARSFCVLAFDSAKGVHVVVKAGKAGSPVLATLEEGKGNITVVALDLYSQLMNVHPGVHRLLANLLFPIRP